MKKTTFKTFLPLLAIALAGVALATSCEKNNSDVTEIGDVSDIVFTPCDENLENKTADIVNPDSIVVNAIDGIVYVEHHNFGVTCGVDTVYVSVSSSRNNDTIVVMENPYPTNPNINCVCFVSNCFQIRNIKSGTYVLVIKENPIDVIYSQSITI